MGCFETDAIDLLYILVDIEGYLQLKGTIDSMEEKKETVKQTQDENQKDQDIFEVNEIKIEEMAIDGICGVY